MKVTKEYDVAGSATNPATGEKLYALKATGNCCIYTDDGELLEATDEAHLQANIQAQKEAELKEHYKKLHNYYEAEYGI